VGRQVECIIVTKVDRRCRGVRGTAEGRSVEADRCVIAVPLPALRAGVRTTTAAALRGAVNDLSPGVDQECSNMAAALRQRTSRGRT